MTLGWSDGNTFLPVNSCLLASAKESNTLDRQNLLIKAQSQENVGKLAQMKAPDATLHLLDSAVSNGISADYVLFNCWFSNPTQITAINSRGMDVIVMLKKSSKIHYEYEGQKFNIKQIYAKNKKRRGRSKYLLSVNVMIGKEKADSC